MLLSTPKQNEKSITGLELEKNFPAFSPSLAHRIYISLFPLLCYAVPACTV